MTTAHNRHSLIACGIAIAVVALALPLDLRGVTVQVRDPAGNPVSGFRWLLEEDNTNQPTPGVSTANIIALDIHQSHAPVVSAGHSDTDTAVIAVPDATKRYFVSVLPDAGYTMSGTMVPDPNGSVSVVVNQYPIPTAQITVFVFHDRNLINNAPDGFEEGLPGFTVQIADSLGQQMMDAFGNPLGTTYVSNPDGGFEVAEMGNGFVVTDANGEAVIENIAPGKYAVTVSPPTGQDWYQTTTIEGSPVIDAWVKAGEGPLLVEFGPAFSHIFMGFVQPFDILNSLPNPTGETGSITGRLVYSHTYKPPMTQGFFPGPVIPAGLVGLNTPTGQGVYFGLCDADGYFTINNVPPGTYGMVTLDVNLDSIIGFHTVALPDLNGNMDLNLGDVQNFAWWGNLEGSVFYDEDADGFRDEGEIGMPDQAVNLRFRDGRLYQGTATDPFGNYALTRIFPFFKWLVAEVDFLRFRDTGFTNVVDDGGPIPPHDGWNMPSFGKLNPQPQAEVNINTGNNLSRTEVADAPGATLLQGIQIYAGQTNIVDWGKRDYEFGESGGISGIVYYAITRAEDDPAFAAGEDWEPGIPRVQISLYADGDGNAQIDDLDGDGLPTLADRDNYPLGWFDDPGNPAAKGPEDVDWDGDGLFDPGDAIQIAHTDSWDDNQPTGCIQTQIVVNGELARECYDNFGTWNQLRPGVFDGGFAIASHFPGGIASGSEEVGGLPPGLYIVEAATPPGYELVKEEDKNVDFGDEYVPNALLAFTLPPPTPPPVCVGDDHEVPDVLSLFPTVEAPFAGETRPLCDRKWVAHSGGQNTAANFFFFTYVPKAARGVGVINNDLAAEGAPDSPVFGEKQAPSWIPISWQDFNGNELHRTYSDEFGSYNVLLPSTYSVNVPAPSGVAPHMVHFVLNHPGPIPDPSNPGETMIDPYFDPSYSQTGYTFNFTPGAVTYLDTPVVPVAAFVGYPNRALDAEPLDHTPVIYSVMGPTGGPIVCNNNDIIEIRSRGQTQVGNPNYDPNDPNSPVLITRDYGFGTQRGGVKVGNADLTINSWSPTLIRARVNTNQVSTGQLIVRRGDNNRTTLPGITLHVGGCNNVVHVTGGANYPATPIQDAIDNAASGTLIIVEPGVYKENVVIWKNVRLQGSGAASTIINGNPNPTIRVSDWHDKIKHLIDEGDVTPILNDNRFFVSVEAPTIFLLTNPDTFTANSPGWVDGFSIIGSTAGGGVYVNGYGQYTSISNNQISGNLGSFGGAITVGTPANVLAPQTSVDSFNDYINIHHNWIAKNGGGNGGGGITILTGADNYNISDNMIIGCFSRLSGGGICHSGLSDGGTIARNTVLFNEVYSGGDFGGQGGGIYIAGSGPNAGGNGTGSGSVLVDSNLIKGNIAGSGSGGGLRALNINGADGLGTPDTWYRLDVVNNIIANNVAAYQGGGIALQDAARVNIIHNTIANNDSSGTASLAFPPGDLLHSLPQGAGIVSSSHSPALALATGQEFSDPVLYNNIVWHNRSYSWDGTLNGNTGGLVPGNPLYWDLQVAGAAGSMNPQYCLLSSTAGYANTNRDGDPRFVSPYLNNLVGIGLLEEGGNAVTIRHTNLDRTVGDYHIGNQSAAINQATSTLPAGADVPALDQDFDGNNRGGNPDIGGDERGGQPVPIAAAQFDPTLLLARSASGGQLQPSLPAWASGMTPAPTALFQPAWSRPSRSGAFRGFEG